MTILSVNSDTSFQRKKTFIVSDIDIQEEMATPLGGHVFHRIKWGLASFVEGHLVVISSKLFLILTIVFRENILSFLYRYIGETGYALDGHVFL